MANDTRTHQVSLGCGTLILIAIIVLIFSGRGTSDVAHEVQLLRFEVGKLKESIEAQTAEIKSLRQKLNKQQGAAKDE